MVVCTFWF